MNDKILVEVKVPSINATYDVFIPRFLMVNEVIYLLTSQIRELSLNRYVASEDTVLCHLENNKILDINKTVESNKLKNGSKLILI